MQDRLPNKPGRILITPEDGSKPFYATVTRADEPFQEGDALNKANLLKDQTAARYGKGSNAVPDTIFDQIAEELDRYSFAQAGGMKMAYGSYVGDGTHGAANPNRLSFDFEPVFVIISTFTNTAWRGLFHRNSLSYSLSGWPAGTAFWMDLEANWEGNTLTWHCVEEEDQPYGTLGQFNENGTTYHYVAIGLGNTGLDFDRLDYMTLLGDDDEEVDA